MIGPNFIDEIDCGSFFDTIDDLLDFPNDDVESGLGPAPDCNGAFNNSLWPNQSGSLPAPNDAVFSAGNSASDLSAELSVPVSHTPSLSLSLSVLPWHLAVSVSRDLREMNVTMTS